MWKWEWLERNVNNELVGRFIRKIKVKGLARCNLCRKDINYGGRGWKSLEQHLQKKLHQDNLKIRSSNYSLSGAFGKSKDPEQVPYGIHPMFKSCAKIQEPAPLPITPLNDRIVNAESMILSFMAENSLSISLVPGLIELSKTLAKDRHWIP